jgi:predicted RNA binding protein YcfA (HicA-like mRNA interferase family)
MTPRDQAIKELEANGYRFERHGGNHDVYYNPEIKCSIPVKRHKFSENALRYIRKEIKQNRRNGD